VCLKVVRPPADNLRVERRCLTGAFLLPVAIAILLAIVPPAATGAARTTRQAGVAASVVRQINAIRASLGLSRLRVNDQLVDAARAHSLEMASRGYFSHRSADGEMFWQRVRQWYALRPHWLAGENLLWRRPRIGGVRVVRLWLASPPHRANLVDPSWRDVGCSVVHARAAPGVFAGAPVTVVTCDFGARS
jgi:uncharacterized protein YkwD